MRHILFGLCLALAGPAAADPLGLTDYEALFVVHAEAVTHRDDGGEVLVLGDVVIERHPGGEMVILDTSAQGALGCTMVVVAGLEGMVAGCPGAQEARLAGLDRLRGALLETYVAGAPVPPDPDAVDAAWQALVRQQTPAEQCPQEPEFLEFVDALVALGSTSEGLDTLRGAPRLAAMNPCL